MKTQNLKATIESQDKVRIVNSKASTSIEALMIRNAKLNQRLNC